MRITEKYLIELGDELTKRFPDLKLSTISNGWAVFRTLVNRGNILRLSVPLYTNTEALCWMDGFHKGADEREQQIRIAIGKLFEDRYKDGGDDDKLLAMLTTWLPR